MRAKIRAIHWLAALGAMNAGTAAGQPTPAPPAPDPLLPPPPPPAEPAKAEPPPVSITPYGLLVTNFFVNTRPVLNNDVPLAAVNGDDTGASLGATARQSRFGFTVKAPAAAAAIGAQAVEATLELDFFGGHYATNNNSYYMQLLPRLRLAFAAMSWKRLKLVVGQDWALLATVNPDSLNHMVLPGFSNTGNLWNRLPQVKVEVKAGPVTLSAAILAPTDATATGIANVAAIRDPNAAEKSLVPSAEARVAYATKLGKTTVTVGAAGHLGREEISADPIMAIDEQHVASYGGAADVNVAVGTLVAVKAEGYFGANLDGFFSNASIHGSANDRRPTKVKGGWAQLSIKPGKAGVHLGAGMEDPDADDGQVLAMGAIRLNWGVYTALTWALGPKLNVGVEFDHLRTHRQGVTDTAKSNHVNATFQLGF